MDDAHEALVHGVKKGTQEGRREGGRREREGGEKEGEGGRNNKFHQLWIFHRSS